MRKMPVSIRGAIDPRLAPNVGQPRECRTCRSRAVGVRLTIVALAAWMAVGCGAMDGGARPSGDLHVIRRADVRGLGVTTAYEEPEPIGPAQRPGK